MDTLKLPEFPNWAEMESIDYGGSFWNDNDISNLNSTLIKTAINLKTLNSELTKYERKKVKKEIEYKHKYRTSLLESNGKTESQKKLLAEIACSELEWQIEYLNEVIKELNRLSVTLRTELDILKTIGHNLRQEMKL